MGTGGLTFAFWAGDAVINGDFAAINKVRILGIGSGFAVLFDADGVPIVKGDFAIHAAAIDAGGTGILLAAAEAIREGVVGRDVIHGGGGLVIPVAPGCAPVGGDDAALIADKQDDVRVCGVHPALLIIVAAGCASDGGPGEACVFGAPVDSGTAIDDVGVLGIDGDGGEIAAADATEGAVVRGVAAGGAGFEDAGVVGGKRPVIAAIGGFVERDIAAAATTGSASIGAGGGACFGCGSACCHGGVDKFRVAGGDGEIGLDDRRQAAGELLPGGATVDGSIDAAIGAAEGSVFIEALLLLPERGVENGRVSGIEAHVVAAGVFVFVENLFEVLAAVGGAENAALGVGSVGMAEGSDVEAVGVFGIDFNVGDHLGIAKTEVSPALAGVDGFIDTIAGGEIGADDASTGADVDDVGVGGRDSDGADGAGGLGIEEGLPGGTVVSGAPDTAVIETDIEDVGLAGDAGQSAGTSGAGRADLTPVHFGIEVRRDGLSLGERGEG